jgi:1-deoxy-D-xylulose-5-phosphate synthase
LIGGFGSMVKNYLLSSCVKVVSMGIPDDYIEHGSRMELLDEVNLNIEGLVDSINEINYEKE